MMINKYFTKYVLFIVLFIKSTTFYSQQMDKGFVFLETGKYKEAAIYFKEILTNYSTNKTARLCYGRAIGLSGETQKALTLFDGLLKDFPEDFEVKLNYAEALLWNKNYSEAKIFYKKLVDEKELSFPALLGYANTLSNLKEYEEALVYVKKALLVSPKNANALISKKYIHLGLANSKIPNKDYLNAESILKENFIDFKNDKETRLNLANLYLISNQLEKAQSVYTNMSKNPSEKLIGLNGMALTYHLKNKDKQALLYSKKAFNSLDVNSDSLQKQQTVERYIQALIWNKKYTSAKTKIDQLIKESITPENWKLALRATLSIYKSDFKESLLDYNHILKKDSASFDGNLGKANTLKALGRYMQAYESAENTLKYYYKQKDATDFVKNLDKDFTPFLEKKASYTFDNGNNKAYNFIANVTFPISTRTKLLANYNYRTTFNTITDLSANSNNFMLGASYQILDNVTLKSSLGVTSSKIENETFNKILADFSLNIKPFKLQDLEIGYQRDIQNFNAELLGKQIVQNNFLVNYSLNTNFNLGWFMQYYYTTQSDKNTRNLLFTSLYYTLLQKPAFKTGVNYQTISFKNQVPTVYFSPKTFNAVEIFINLIKDENNLKKNQLFYELTAAAGYQFIEEQQAQSTFRFQGKFGLIISERSLVNLYGLRSNIASATAAGFNFTEIGIRFKFYLSKKPIFKNFSE